MVASRLATPRMAKKKEQTTSRGDLMRQIAALYAQMARNRDIRSAETQQEKRAELERRIAELKRKLMEM
jgi:hypothetical protein